MANGDDSENSGSRQESTAAELVRREFAEIRRRTKPTPVALETPRRQAKTKPTGTVARELDTCPAPRDGTGDVADDA